jgi:hypothetical protein
MVKNSSNSNFTSLLAGYCDISIGYPERPIAAHTRRYIPQVRNAPYRQQQGQKVEAALKVMLYNKFISL